jgi:hypothetical protein
MAELENERAAGSGRGSLRASDADREHVVGTLKAAYVHGLVTKDEFDARVSQTFASRTYAELALITADIPAGLAAAPPLRPGPAKAGPPAHASLTPGERAMMGTGLLAALALLVALLAGGAAGGAGPGSGRQRFRVRVPPRRPGAQLPAQQALRQSPASAASNSQRPGSWPPGGIWSLGRTAPGPWPAWAARPRRRCPAAFSEPAVVQLKLVREKLKQRVAQNAAVRRGVACGRLNLRPAPAQPAAQLPVLAREVG